MKTQFSLGELRDRVAGPVLAPRDPGFEREVSGFNVANSFTPDVVVGVTNKAAVLEAVRFAARHQLPIRILSTGHGPIDPVTQGMLVTTRRLNGLSIDPDTRIASVGAGLKWEAVQAAASPLGLTAITGSSPGVGAVGFVLGGGLGSLARSHGFTSDCVRSFSVVTGDGEAVTASATSHPELFWALRGGKGGLGIVTEMHIELVALPMIYAGAIGFDEPHIEQVLRGWINWSANAPQDVTTSVAMIHCPPFDEVPEPIRGRYGIAVALRVPRSGCRWCKNRRSAARPRPGHDGHRRRAPHLDDGAHPQRPDGTAPGLGSRRLVELDRSGLRECPARPTRPPGARHAGRVVAAIAPWASQETNPNFAEALRGWEQFERSWPSDIFTRLSAVKKQYDLHGLFRYGPPAN